MDKVLSLMDEEVADFTIPQATWDCGIGACHLTLVGRLVSHRSVHFEALKGSLTHLIQASRGLLIRKVSESRFCLVFNHIEDLRRVLDMRPSFASLMSFSILDAVWVLGWMSHMLNRMSTGSKRKTLWILVRMPLILGAAPDALRPTYVRQFQSATDSAIPVQRGTRIFGEFGNKNNRVSTSVSSAGAVHVTSPGLPEQLLAPSQQLRKGKAVGYRQLIDESSASEDSNLAGKMGLEHSSRQAQVELQHCPLNWVGSSFARPLILDPAGSSSAQSGPDLFGPVQGQPRSNDSPSHDLQGFGNFLSIVGASVENPRSPAHGDSLTPSSLPDDYSLASLVRSVGRGVSNPVVPFSSPSLVDVPISASMATGCSSLSPDLSGSRGR
ncbi:hypothetical protein Salat_0896800 [Sesamum alatum]|uniref:Uncharacterized protein n=1 Tax=Sesamum alatum TaxID=300844 RepID=A0AAE1YJS2_9LAMI|nr:hypothetical protein Salat_0896800 [Sesamum alatum]